MPNQVTVTAKYGPALQATARVISPITKLEFDFDQSVLHVWNDGNHSEFDLVGVTVTTDTITGAIHVWVVS